MVIGKTLSKILQFVNKLCAFIVLLGYVVYAINANWTFITNETLLQILSYLMYYGPIAVCGLVLLEFGLKRNLIIQIVVFIIIGIVVIFQFFPDTFSSIVTHLNK